MGWIFKAGDRIEIIGKTDGLISIDAFKQKFGFDPSGKEFGDVVELLNVPWCDVAVSSGPHVGTSEPNGIIEPVDVMAIQHGGNHYKGLKIQPTEYSLANALDCLQFSVVKYVTRHKLKGGAEDLKKCIHFAQMALKEFYGVESSVSYEETKKAGE